MSLADRLTPLSIRYRRIAAEFARKAEAIQEQKEALLLVDSALSWIQLAENEETLKEAHDRPMQ